MTPARAGTTPGNLRVCLKFQNNRNARPRTDNTSGFKGVNWYAKGNKFAAGISLDNKRRHIGYFDTAEAAARAYDLAAQKAWGDFAWLNFSDERLSDVELDARIRTLLKGRKSFLTTRWAA